METEIRWGEVDGAGWRWVHGLEIPNVDNLCKTFIEKFDSFTQHLRQEIFAAGKFRGFAVEI